MSKGLYQGVFNNNQVGLNAGLASGFAVTDPIINILDPDALVYKEMVEADGGFVVDINYVSNFIKLLKVEDAWDNKNVFFFDPNMGLKKGVGNKVAKLYSIKGTVHPVQASTTPQLSLATGLNGKNKLVGISTTWMQCDGRLPFTHLNLNGYMMMFLLKWASAAPGNIQYLAHSVNLSASGAGGILMYMDDGASYNGRLSIYGRRNSTSIYFDYLSTDDDYLAPLNTAQIITGIYNPNITNKIEVWRNNTNKDFSTTGIVPSGAAFNSSYSPFIFTNANGTQRFVGDAYSYGFIETVSESSKTKIQDFIKSYYGI